MSVHIDDVFMAGKPDILENIKDVVKLRFNIQQSGKLRNFIGV